MGDGKAAVPWWRLLGLTAVLASLVAAVLIDTTTRSSAGKGPGNVGRRDAGGPVPGTASSRPATAGLLPNLGVLPAANIVVDTSGPGRRLRFDSTLTNRGDGPLELVPQDLPRCPRGQRHVAQVVYTDADGDRRYARRTDRARSVVASGCMLFHRRHDHWHVDGSAAYALTPAGSRQPVAERDKVSFCLRDSDRLRRGQGSAKTYGECSRDKRQGMSVGWSDLYDASLAGQTLALRSVPDGPYCLRLRADPRNLFRETDESDNTSAVPLRLVGDRVTVAGAGSGLSPCS